MKAHVRWIMALAAACALCASTVSAAIRVESAAPTSTSFSAVQGTYVDANGFLHIPASALNADKQFRVFSDLTDANGLPTEAVPRIVLDNGGSASSDFDFIIANVTAVGTVNGAISANLAAGTDWDGLQQGAYKVRLYGRVLGDLVGPVVVRNLVRLEVGGALRAPNYVEHTAPAAVAVLGAIEIAGDVDAGTYISATQSDIGRVNIFGNLRGHVESLAGSINEVNVTGEIKGRIWAAKAIDTIIAGSIARVPGQLLPGQTGFRAQIDATGTNNSNPADIWTIGTITVSGDIGTATDPVIIRTDATSSSVTDQNWRNGGIELIQSRSAYIDVATPTGTGGTEAQKRGDIKRILINPSNSSAEGAGVLAGTISTFSLGYNPTDVNEPASLQVNGVLEGSVLLDGTIKRPSSISRGVAAGGTLSLLERDLNQNGGVTITGDMAGRIEVEGNKDAPITINNGNVTGTIAVGKNVRNVAATNRDYGGRIHVNGGSLTSTGRIEVGGSVIDNPNFVEIEISGDMAGTIDVGRSLAGQLKVNAATGLKGQVIINSDNQTGANLGTWTGNVTVGSTVLGPKPIYTQSAASLGGGAVGLAPFRLYPGDCLPRHNNPSATPYILSTDFGNSVSVPVKIAFYGPVKLDAATVAADALMIEVQNPANPCQWWDMTTVFRPVVLPPTSGGTRLIGLGGTGQGLPYPGLYRVTNLGIASKEVVAEPMTIWPTESWTNGSPPVACPAPDIYLFRITGDCNANGIPDAADIAETPALDTNANGLIDACEITNDVCRCDWNNTAVVSVQDLFDFLTDYFANAGDFNGSGSTSVQDIFDFLFCFFSLPPPCQRE